MRALLFVLVGGVWAAACSTSSSTPPPDYTGSCRQLASRCHPYDEGGGLGHECHELGHEGDDQKCGPRREECLAACPPKDGGTEHEDASADAGSDSGGDAAHDAGDGGDTLCTAYCACMTATCAAITGYPYTAPGSCESACAGFDQQARACWPKFCEEAKDDADKKHNCEHAWGVDPHCD